MTKIIDIHTHFFNLKYLPVAGILVRYGNGIISENIAFTVEHFLINNTKSIFDEVDELFEKSELNETIAENLGLELDLGTITDFPNLEFSQVKNGILSDITVHQIMQPVARIGLEEFQAMALKEGLITDEEVIDFSIYDEESFMGFGSDILNWLYRLVEKLLNWISEKVKSLVNYIKWFRFMQKSEEAIFNYFLTKDGSEVDLYVHHMMDVDYYFNSKEEPTKFQSYFNFKEKQIDNMFQLNEKHKDKMFGFVAFDPSKPNGVEIVKDAIENRGFKGIKFYPPMGYKAFQDANFKEHIDLLFDYCIENDIPIFSHCNNKGFEAYPKMHSGYDSNPMFWYRVLEQEKYHQLRLCLAHAGGDEGWFAKNNTNDQIKIDDITDISMITDTKDKVLQGDWNSSYSKIVYKLCVTYPNVYCDAAYLEQIVHTDMKSNLTKRFKKLFEEQSGFSKKIMYGSDWHMLFQEGINAIYLADFKDFFNQSCFTDEQREDFFRNNALRYLKM